jgi:hypothetical protein
MAAANESQGLKIAVAAFVTLSVILSISTYFAYQAYTQSDARLASAEQKLKTANDAADTASRQNKSFRDAIGVRAEDDDAVKAEIEKSQKKNSEEIHALVQAVAEMVSKAQSAGAQGPELEDATAKVKQLASAYSSEPNKTFISSLDRETELMKYMGLVMTQLSLNFTDVKRNLESANTVNAQKLKVETDALAKAKTDLSDVHDKHLSDRQSILGRLDRFQSDNAKQAAEIANLQAKLRETTEDLSKKLAIAQQTIREYRATAELKETVLDRPDGVLTFVDYNRGEVHTNLTRSMGVRPQMVLSVFDAASPGIPTDKPKGTIELIQVNDRESIGRITKTNNSIDPLRNGDLVYSPAWSPNEPMKFALIGKIDMDRNGRDDRGDLKRLIEQAGGIVSYDLPPPEVGKETGRITGEEAWYVIDKRMPFREVYGNTGVTASENDTFLKKQSDVVREARLNGVRPMPIERLLPYLGYDFLAPVRGRAEAVDVQSLKRLTAPRQDANKAQAVQPAEPANEDEGDMQK